MTRVLDGMADALRRFLRICYRNQNLLFVVTALATMSIFAFVSGYWFFYRAAYVLGGLVIVCLIWARVHAGALEVAVERANDRLQVGQEAEARVRLRSRSKFTKVWLEAEDETDMPGTPARTVLTLPSNGSRNWKVNLRCARRGIYRAGPVRITTGDPFGLFRLTRTYGEGRQLLVLPRPEELPYFWSPVAQLPGEGSVRRRTHYVTPNASGVRDYYPGDSYNRIHWRSTARLGRLMVKTFEMDPTSNVWVLVDLDGAVQGGAGDESTEEYGVRIATSLAYHFVQSNRVLGLIAFGEEAVVLDPTRGSQQYGRILEALAMARASGVKPLSLVLEEEGRRFGRHTTLIIVTPSTSESWEAASFGAEQPGSLRLEALSTLGVPAYVVRCGSDISLMLGPAGMAAHAAPERQKATAR
ncbi:MAG: DUF58 domain-containing protein [Chloroflexi bacterium]|nr:MAG: DUF58 domain-containing protein [Chloroflexota bacterium]